MKKANILFNVVLIIAAAYFFIESLSFPDGADLGGIGPAFFPQMMLLLLIGFCLIDIVNSIRKKSDSRFFEGSSRTNIISISVVLGSMLAMIFLLGKMPFILIAAAMILCQCLILKLKLIPSLLTSIILSVSIYLIFVKGFSVLL
ncbi:tripartite tricarboxylate transporter TctB family protein [Cytobacillus oceanisediminis]|uniref:tripartite tricarboxylate transporter TctB family protein n=1 Tax=Cytobacillus oceanisediminis TaxID=665099 RepID=UPI003734E0A6